MSPTKPIKLETKEQVEEFLDLYDDFLFDCDGVLWTGNHLLPSVVETLDLLRKHNKRLIFVTNNSTKSRRAYATKFRDLGLEVTPEEIFGSSYSAAVYLDKVISFPKQTQKVLVIGEEGIEEELQECGISYVGGSDPELRKPLDEEKLAQIKRDPSIGAVLCGLDRHINYQKIASAMAQLVDPQVPFLATNTDSTFPVKGRLLPGAGTMVGSLETCTGRTPIALGKPAQAMMDCIKAKFRFNPERACMIGDRLNTDMLFGINGGLGTLFVLTGVDKEEAIFASDAVAVPRHYIDKLGSLYEFISAS